MTKPTTAKFGKMRVLLGQPTLTPIAVTSLKNSNPAEVTVGAADIAKFHNGDRVIIAGAIGQMLGANGEWVISSVGVPANSFKIAALNLAAASAPQTTGITAKNREETGVPIVYASPCGLTTKNFALTKNLQEIDLPDCDDPDAPAWIARDVQNLSATISGDGVAAAESVPAWNAAAISTDSVPMKVEIEFTTGMKIFTGLFIVDNLTFGAESGGRVTLAINAQSDGEVDDQWVPTP
jgi:hypothetical protein